MKRFGCLVFFLILGGKVEKGTSKWRRGVFLGYNGSGYKVGSWVTDARKQSRFEERNLSFSEKTTIQVRFFENILVGDLEWLKPGHKGVFVKFDKLDSMLEGKNSGVETLGPELELNNRVQADVGRRANYTGLCRLAPGHSDEPHRRSGDVEDSDSFSDSSSEKGVGLERNSRSSAEARSSGAEARKQKKRRAREGRKTLCLIRGVVGTFRECEISSDCSLHEDGTSQCWRKTKSPVSGKSHVSSSFRR